VNGSPHTLFVSDLHLSPEHPHTTGLFLDFLAQTAPAAEALYILGDLFEYWAGDDDLDAPLNLQVTRALAALAARGTRLFLLHGNRDFLLGDGFQQTAHTTLLPDPSLIDLYGTPTLLMHGDTLCTDDAKYLAFRARVRDPAFQAEFLRQPLAQRKATIEDLRRQSEQDKGLKSEALMDVNAQAVAKTLRAHGHPRLIHGHTHRPARHIHQVDGQVCERWVLGAWDEDGSYLRCDDKGCAAASVSRGPVAKG
jgi:UDP-2,3-diacylglucosamine hydrolase